MQRFLWLIPALTLPLSSSAVTIETVPIGNPNNTGDFQTQGIFGRVADSYRIGVTEVTNAQYTDFLNAVAATDPYGLYDSSMGFSTKGGISRSGSSGSYTYAVKTDQAGQGPGGSVFTYADKPVVFVTWYDAVRFANWLHNGQGSASTETGAYALLGGTPTPSNGDSITRSPGANWFLPSEDEWYKAAYYDGTADVYYNYPTGSDAVPDNNLPSADSGNSANFLQTTTTTENLDYPYTAVGVYTQSESSYGTFDQGGNVWEWNERLLGTGMRGRRGGAWDTESPTLDASNQGSFFAGFQNDKLGFRVATIQQSEGLGGDFNNDGKVDAADYVVWRKNIGTQQEYDNWRANFGMMAPGSGGVASAVAVPEPACALLLAIGIGLFSGRRCRRIALEHCR